MEIKKNLFKKKQKEKTFLRLVSKDHYLKINGVSGKETIAKAEEVFAVIDSNFTASGMDKIDPMETVETEVEIYEMINGGTQTQNFRSLKRRIVFTQNQIIEFVRQYPNWLRKDGHATFFAFNFSSETFVAIVSIQEDESLRVSFERYEDSGIIRNKEAKHWLVVPK